MPLIEETAEFVLGQGIVLLGQLLAGGNGLGEAFGGQVSAASGGRDQQRVVACMGQQREKRNRQTRSRLRPVQFMEIGNAFRGNGLGFMPCRLNAPPITLCDKADASLQKSYRDFLARCAQRQ